MFAVQWGGGVSSSLTSSWLFLLQRVLLPRDLIIQSPLLVVEPFVVETV